MTPCLFQTSIDGFPPDAGSPSTKDLTGLSAWRAQPEGQPGFGIDTGDLLAWSNLVFDQEAYEFQ